MGIAGGAILPQLYANLAKVMPPQAAYLVAALPCYLYILYYAVRGHRAGRATATAPLAVAAQAGGP